MKTDLALFYRRLASRGPRNVGEQVLLAGLIPLGWLYGLINFIRALLYRYGIVKSYCSPVPVISVGNLAVGGTGKTPLVDYLIKTLQRQGRRVAVVSRGYGAEKGAPVRLVCDGAGPLLTARQCGDEPFLLAQRNPQACVIIAPERAAGIEVAVSRCAAEVVILDDAYQHLAVRRDLNLLLLDSRNPLGNGQLLPAGLLREFPLAAWRADLAILTRYAGKDPQLPFELPLLRSRQQLSEQGYDLSGHPIRLEQLRHSRCVAFAGIATPDDFFAALAERGVSLQAVVPLADHCHYDAATLARLHNLAQKADYLLTTEKDAVKLSPEMFDVPCCVVPLEIDLLDPEMLEHRIAQLF